MLINKLKILSSNDGFKKYFFNTSWLFATQGLRLFLGFFVSLWVARYLGPEQYGIYNYVLSWLSIFTAICMFGVTDTLIKLIIENPEKEKYLLNAGFIIRFSAGLVAMTFLIICLIIFPQEEIIKSYIILVSPALILHSVEIIDLFYMAKVNVKKSAIVRIAQMLLSNAVKIYLILIKAELIWFISIVVFDLIFYAVVIYYNYRKSYPDFIFISPNIQFIRAIIKKSFPIMIISFLTIIFARIDQILIGNIIDQFQLGLYSSSVKIIEILTIFSLITTQSLFPAILNAKTKDNLAYKNRFISLSRILIISSIFLSVGTCVFSEQIILVLFGENYISAKTALSILSFNVIFISMSHLSHRWYITENLQHIMMLKIIGLTSFNTILNLFLIPRFGIEGAAYSSLISHFIFYFLLEALFKKTRDCFKINFPFFKH